MCSIAMPAELILHSPPVYSPLLYGPLVVTAPTITSRSVPPRIRPCLSSGSLSLDTLRNNDGKQKKRVVFADDRGRPLTQVFPRLFFCAFVEISYTREIDLLMQQTSLIDSHITILAEWYLVFSANIKKKTRKFSQWNKPPIALWIKGHKIPATITFPR